MSVLASRVRAAILRIGDPFTVSGDSRIGRSG